MQTFSEFLTLTLANGAAVNTMFEEQVFALVGTLERIAQPLSSENVPYELIGGGAVMVHVNRVDPSAVRNTKEIDILVRRDNLDHIKDVAGRYGFTFRETAGPDIRSPGGEIKARNAVHLVFTGERVKSTQVVPNPPIRPEHLSIHGVNVVVIPVADLIQIKLSNNRDIDRVHVRDLDSVGLIAHYVENGLPAALHERLEEIRRTE